MVRVKDVSETGLGVEAPSPLEKGCLVRVTGTIIAGLKQKILQGVPARVTYCNALKETSPKPTPAVLYSMGLQFTADSSNGFQLGQSQEAATDYYEILQLSPKADIETIHRVYRLLAQRYHPDNSETGDQDTFKVVLEAYRVLSDPEERASYDAAFTRKRQLRWKIFDQADSTQGREGEKRKRSGVLSVLYAQRMSQPSQPGANIHELEDLLGCPREHLEFTLWYLKESGCILRTDNGRYTITVKGVDVSDSFEETPALPDHRLLPAPR